MAVRCHRCVQVLELMQAWGLELGESNFYVRNTALRNTPVLQRADTIRARCKVCKM